MWNNLGPELRGAESLSILKKNVLKLYRPVKRSLFNIHEPKCIKWIFQLRVGLSPLKSHKRRHNFQDTPDDTCHCMRDAESTYHFLLHCPTFTEHRRTLFETIDPIIDQNILLALDDKDFEDLLLYGSDWLSLEENQTILKATINFIRMTSRFSQI